MRLLIIFTLLTICLAAMGQTLDSESRYTDSAGKDVLIQSSFPKGMVPLDSTGKAGYSDATGKFFAYVVFWTRVTNETDTPLELTVNFPAVFPSPYSYLKLFLPQDTMTLDKETLINYGVTGLKSFLDTNFNKPTILQRTIKPKGESIFYIVALSSKLGNSLRARLVLKEHNLFYNIRGIGPELDTTLIPCGQIVFKK
ncbi:MAG: hypothetical protein JNM78_15350 [Cyclobacteriaceae bacterium]|nr:hypothetical protein [Cyclobacteriaceae bacterium]